MCMISLNDKSNEKKSNNHLRNITGSEKPKCQQLKKILDILNFIVFLTFAILYFTLLYVNFYHIKIIKAKNKIMSV